MKEQTKEIEDLAAAQEAAGDIVPLKLDESAIDIIGLDVFRLNKSVSTVEEANAAIEKFSTTTVGIVEIAGSTFVIRATLAKLNELNAMDPSDMETHEAIPVQVKIAELLQEAGLNVGVNQEMKDIIEKEIDNIKEESTVDSCSA
jgi:hypothetical protein